MVISRYHCLPCQSWRISRLMLIVGLCNCFTLHFWLSSFNDGKSIAAVYRHNNHNLTHAAKCTEEQRKTIERQLLLSNDMPYTRMQVGFFRCPQAVWLEE